VASIVLKALAEWIVSQLEARASASARSVVSLELQSLVEQCARVALEQALDPTDNASTEKTPCSTPRLDLADQNGARRCTCLQQK
jgi:hypothetical protein